MQKYGKNEQVIEVRNGYAIAQQSLNGEGFQFWIHDVTADTFTFFWTLKDARAHADSQPMGSELTEDEMLNATDGVWLNSVRTDENDDRDAQAEFEAQTAELMNEAVQLAVRADVIEEAQNMTARGMDYSTMEVFFNPEANLGMYSYQEAMIDGQWPNPEIWIVDCRLSGCIMDHAVKLVRVI